MRCISNVSLEQRASRVATVKSNRRGIPHIAGLLFIPECLFRAAKVLILCFPRESLMSSTTSSGDEDRTGSGCRRANKTARRLLLINRESPLFPVSNTHPALLSFAFTTRLTDLEHTLISKPALEISRIPID